MTELFEKNSQYTLLEKERDRLYELADMFGMNHPKVLKQSQILDIYVNDYYKNIKVDNKS
ncbi:aspartyl-phosphate phosphatase Spo0E family protein [Paenibacillus sp. 1A_MP2]|uniref:aspartyl-phosphate phosphatase Spo0E family protein n=1 Tax=Paenibacillus sp. 1A_MP2 TaxID=3457495 RepID=UPI003FCE57F5